MTFIEFGAIRPVAESRKEQAGAAIENNSVSFARIDGRSHRPLAGAREMINSDCAVGATLQSDVTQRGASPLRSAGLNQLLPRLSGAPHGGLVSAFSLEETEALSVLSTTTPVEIAPIEKLDEDLECEGRSTPRQAADDDHHGEAAFFRGASKPGPEVADQTAVTMLLLVNAVAGARRVQRIQRETPTFWLPSTRWTRWTGPDPVKEQHAQEVGHGQ